MRVAALYDIHGNLPALEAVLAEIDQARVDGLVVGGDVVAGPLPRETLQLLEAQTLPVHFVRGNADREVIAAFDAGPDGAQEEQDPAARAAAFAASKILRAQRDLLADFEPTIELELGSLGPALFCHGSPRSDTEVLTAVTPPTRMSAILSGTSQTLVVCGHTHRQFDRRVGDQRVINAGSVGMPYEGRAGAYWALIGPGIELRRTEYNLADAIARMRAGGFPEVEKMLRESLLAPADPDWVARFFEGQAEKG